MAKRKLETEQRLEQIEEWYAEGVTIGQLRQKIRNEWSVTTRSANRYLLQLRERWTTESATNRSERRAELRQKLEAHYEACRQAGAKGLQAGTKTLESLGRLDGLIDMRAEQVEAAAPKGGFGLDENDPQFSQKALECLHEYYFGQLPEYAAKRLMTARELMLDVAVAEGVGRVLDAVKDRMAPPAWRELLQALAAVQGIETGASTPLLPADGSTECMGTGMPLTVQKH